MLLFMCGCECSVFVLFGGCWLLVRWCVTVMDGMGWDGMLCCGMLWYGMRLAGVFEMGVSVFDVDRYL